MDSNESAVPVRPAKAPGRIHEDDEWSRRERGRREAEEERQVAEEQRATAEEIRGQAEALREATDPIEQEGGTIREAGGHLGDAADLMLQIGAVDAAQRAQIVDLFDEVPQIPIAHSRLTS